MLRRPSLSSSPAGSTATPVLARRDSARTPLAAGVVPRMRRPRGAAGPAVAQAAPAADSTGQDAAERIPRGQGTALHQRIEHHLARMQGVTLPPRPGTIDDDRARRDPDTTSFAVVRPDAAAPDATRSPARVATAADRPRTAEFPAAPSIG